MFTESRTFPIKDKVITIEDIKRMAAELGKNAAEFVVKNIEGYSNNISYYREYSKIEDEVERNTFKSRVVIEQCKCSYKLQSSNGSVYKGYGIDILNRGYLENDFIDRITISFNSSYQGVPDALMHLDITHSVSKYSSNSTFTVEGQDELWVSGVFQRMEDQVRRCEDQFIFFRNYDLLVTIVLSMSIGYFIISGLNKSLAYAINYYYKKQIRDVSAPMDYVDYIISAMSGFGPATYLTNKTNKLWPTIEIRTGKEYQQMVTKRRQIVGWIVVSIGIPLLFEFIF